MALNTGNKIFQKQLLYPKILWQRPVHKYNQTAGRVMILSGSKNMGFTAIQVCEAVFRSGTGIILLGFPISLRTHFKDLLPEAMALELPETPGHTLAKESKTIILDNVVNCDVAIIGPGLSQNAETTQLIWELLFTIKKPIVLDGDGITALIKGIKAMREHESEHFVLDYFKKRSNELIIVVSPSECCKLFSALRLTKKSTISYTDKNADKISIILSYSLNCIVVVKSCEITIVDQLGNILVTPIKDSEQGTHNKSYEKIIPGIIGSFIGQNPEKELEAIATGIYLYAQAYRMARKTALSRTLFPSDILRCLPLAIKKAEE
jgi:NAD(P)H-hydrate repair Nnr-like enzyme with NAD(P)H-hydrate dehydratase domain